MLDGRKLTVMLKFIKLQILVLLVAMYQISLLERGRERENITKFKNFIPPRCPSHDLLEVFRAYLSVFEKSFHEMDIKIKSWKLVILLLCEQVSNSRFLPVFFLFLTFFTLTHLGTSLDPRTFFLRNMISIYVLSLILKDILMVLSPEL